VEAACREIGGQLVEAGQEARSSSLGSHRFSFSFLQRNWNSAWGECAWLREVEVRVVGGAGQVTPGQPRWCALPCSPCFSRSSCV